MDWDFGWESRDWGWNFIGAWTELNWFDQSWGWTEEDQDT